MNVSGERIRWLPGRTVLLVVEVLVGLSALAGGYGLLADAEGLGMEESWLDGSPFSDYTFPGLFLLVVIGGGMLGAAALAWWRSRFAALAGLTMGMVLLTWLAVETAIIGYVGYEQLLMVVLYGVAGLVLVLASAGAVRQD